MVKPIGPGDVVVCVDASGILPEIAQLIEQARYRVREVCAISHDINGIQTGGCLRLRGIINQIPANEILEPGYDLRRFRPIDDGDAAIFREMVRVTKKHRVLAHE